MSVGLYEPLLNLIHIKLASKIYIFKESFYEESHENEKWYKKIIRKIPKVKKIHYKAKNNLSVLFG